MNLTRVLTTFSTGSRPLTQEFTCLLAKAWRVVFFGPDLSHLLRKGTPVEVWDGIPAVADGLRAAQAAIAGRLPRLSKDDAYWRGA